MKKKRYEHIEKKRYEWKKKLQMKEKNCYEWKKKLLRMKEKKNCHEWKKKQFSTKQKFYARKRKFTHERKKRLRMNEKNYAWMEKKLRMNEKKTNEWKKSYEWMKKCEWMKKIANECKRLRMNGKQSYEWMCLLCIRSVSCALLCAWHLWWAMHTWMIIAHVVLCLYKRSATTKRTENKCNAIVACGWCVAQTLLLTRVPTLPSWRLSVLPTQRTLRSVRSTLSKNSSYLPFEIHICWRFTISQLKNLLWRSPAQPQGLKHVRISARKLVMHLDWKRLQVKLKNNLHIMHTWPPTYNVLHMLKTMQTVWIAEQVFQDFECEFAQRLVQMASVNRSRIVSSSQTELLLAFHPSCITSPRSATFPDSLRDSMPFEHLTLLTWPPTRSSLFARSQPHSTSQACCCCHHDCCNHLWPTCSDHSRILRPGNGFVSVSAGFRSPSNDIQLQVTKCYPALQQQVTCLQVPQTSTDPTSSCNTPCCWAVTADLYRNIGHPVLVMWLNSQARARSSNQSVVLSFSAW